MSLEAEKRPTGYPYGKGRVYWSAIMTLLSVILAFMVLTNPLSLLYYLILTLTLAGIVLAVKVRFLRTGSFLEGEEKSSEAERRGHGWRPLLLLFGLLIAVMLLPMLLAGFHPEGWFVGLISYTSGVSSAEVAFFLFTRKP